MEWNSDFYINTGLVSAGGRGQSMQSVAVWTFKSKKIFTNYACFDELRHLNSMTKKIRSGKKRDMGWSTLPVMDFEFKMNQRPHSHSLAFPTNKT